MNAAAPPRFPEVTVLLGDPRLDDRSKPGARFTADDLDQIVRLKRALAEIPGYAFSFLDDHATLIETLRARPPAFVMNLCDTGYGNDARRELHVPALLEMLDVPYTGSAPAALALCYDKALVRAAAQAMDVPVPREAFVRAGDPCPDFSWPALVKPNTGDGSVGVTEAALVRDAAAARRRVEALHRELPGVDLLVQEFLDGPEYSVGLVGNPGRLEPLSVLEVDYSRLDPALPRILTYGSKVDPESPYWKGLGYREASLEPATRERLVGLAARLFERLGLRDYGRFDFRTAADGAVKLIEVNPNPAWCWDGKMNLMAGFGGRSHADLLRGILEAAQARY